MNELRMHVERLFEGKTMTAEMIDLKEEIYGNLVARYDDCLAKGLEPAEALARAKASITDIDELLDDGSSAKGDAAVTAPGAPQSPVASSTDDGHAAVDKPKRKKWPFVVGGIVAVLAVAIAGGLMIADEVLDHASGVRQDAGAVSATKDDAVTIDAGGTVRLDGKPADDLVSSVVRAGFEDVSDYSGASPDDSASIEALVRTLPMGAWMTGAEASPTSDQLVITYTGVPDAYDDDSVDVAMTYNASAVLIAMPTQKSVQIRVSESDDAADYDVHTFTRENLERRYGFGLESGLLSDQGWKKLKERGVYRGGFAERAADEAEDRW